MKKIFCLICFLVVISIACGYMTFRDMKKKVIYDERNLLVNVDGASVSKLPESGNYYLVDYDCNNNGVDVSWNMMEHKLSISGGKGKISCYLDFESIPKLSKMKSGSFVQYVGNNGCVGDFCSGGNIGSSLKYYYDGWRILYTKNEMVYLVSAGVVDSGCTNGNGDISSVCGSYVTSDNVSVHLNNLNKIALKYCNAFYVNGGVCDDTSVRSISDVDFNYSSKKGFYLGGCYQLQNKKCGYTNDLIDNGGDYWFATAYSSLSDQIMYWSSVNRFVASSKSNSVLGIRPVIMMDKNVLVIGGSGTYGDPYQIVNNTVVIDSVDKNKSVVNLRMSGYQVNEMCVGLNSTVCTNYVPFRDSYVLDISGAINGTNVVYVYYKDRDGKVVAVMDRNFYIG